MPLTSRGLEGRTGREAYGKWKAPRRAASFSRCRDKAKGHWRLDGRPLPGAWCLHPLPCLAHAQCRTMVVDTVMTPQTVVTKKQERQRVVLIISDSECCTLALHCLVVPIFFFVFPVNELRESTSRRSRPHALGSVSSGSCFSPVDQLPCSFFRERRGRDEWWMLQLSEIPEPPQSPSQSSLLDARRRQRPYPDEDAALICHRRQKKDLLLEFVATRWIDRWIPYGGLVLLWAFNYPRLITLNLPIKPARRTADLTTICKPMHHLMIIHFPSRGGPWS